MTAAFYLLPLSFDAQQPRFQPPPLFFGDVALLDHVDRAVYVIDRHAAARLMPPTQHDKGRYVVQTYIRQIERAIGNPFLLVLCRLGLVADTDIRELLEGDCAIAGPTQVICVSESCQRR